MMLYNKYYCTTQSRLTSHLLLPVHPTSIVTMASVAPSPDGDDPALALAAAAGDPPPPPPPPVDEGASSPDGSPLKRTAAKAKAVQTLQASAVAAKAVIPKVEPLPCGSFVCLSLWVAVP